MGTFSKILAFTGIGGGLLAGGLYLRNLKRTSKELETMSKVNIYSFDLKGLTLRIDTVLKNPTKTNMKIMFPFVRIMLGTDMIGSSQVVNQQIKIPSYGEVHIDKVMVQIPIFGLLNLGEALFTPLQSGQSVSAQIVTVTTITLLGIIKVPYETTENVLLKTGMTSTGKKAA